MFKTKKKLLILLEFIKKKLGKVNTALNLHIYNSYFHSLSKKKTYLPSKKQQLIACKETVTTLSKNTPPYNYLI
jgi:hypothetical protein